MVERLAGFSKAVLVTILGLFLLTGFLVTTIASYYVSANNIRENVMTRELPLARDNIHSEIQRILLPPLNVAATMANSVFLRDWILDGEKNVDKIKDYLDKIKNKQRMTSAFLVSDISLNYYSYAGLRGRIDPDAEDNIWYRRCRDNEAPFEINADLDMHVSNRIKLFINYKVYDYNNRFIGITGVATHIESIEQLIRRFKKQYDKTIFFVSPTGQIAFQAERKGIELDKPDLAQYLNSQALADQLLNSESTSLVYQRNGRDVMLTARFLPELQWFLVVEESAHASTEHLRSLFISNLVICIVVTLLVLTIVYLTVQQYQKRLSNRTETVCRQAKELEQKNNELERLNQEKDEFMKIVVHGLKTPLSGMMGLATVIQEESPSTSIQDFAKDIWMAGREMIELIQSLLDLKAIESAQSPKLTPIRLAQVLESAKATWSLTARHKAIELSVEGIESDAMVRANAAWVNTVIGNFVSNAIKYSPSESRIVIRLEQRNDKACISVTDQGQGITPEDQQKLFQQFVQLKNKPTGNESSNGLGLYIAKNMVEKMDGEIGVESEPGKGSRFWVAFPLIQPSTAGD
jgi:signal transduction histidine kinase